MKVFVTKYALSSGIEEHEAETTLTSEKMVRGTGIYLYNRWHKPHWHLTLAEAQAQAEKMRVAKLASLQKQIAKLEKLTF